MQPLPWGKAINGLMSSSSIQLASPDGDNRQVDDCFDQRIDIRGRATSCTFEQLVPAQFAQHLGGGFPIDWRAAHGEILQVFQCGFRPIRRGSWARTPGHVLNAEYEFDRPDGTIS